MISSTFAAFAYSTAGAEVEALWVWAQTRPRATAARRVRRDAMLELRGAWGGGRVWVKPQSAAAGADAL